MKKKKEFWGRLMCGMIIFSSLLLLGNGALPEKWTGLSINEEEMFGIKGGDCYSYCKQYTCQEAMHCSHEACTSAVECVREERKKLTYSACAWLNDPNALCTQRSSRYHGNNIPCECLFQGGTNGFKCAGYLPAYYAVCFMPDCD